MPDLGGRRGKRAPFETGMRAPVPFTKDTGSLKVTVKDTEGTLLPASVKYEHPQRGTSPQIGTENGECTFFQIPPALVTVHVDAYGYGKNAKKTVIKPGMERRVTFLFKTEGGPAEPAETGEICPFCGHYTVELKYGKATCRNPGCVRAMWFGISEERYREMMERMARVPVLTPEWEQLLEEKMRAKESGELAREQERIRREQEEMQRRIEEEGRRRREEARRMVEEAERAKRLEEAEKILRERRKKKVSKLEEAEKILRERGKKKVSKLEEAEKILRERRKKKK